MTETARVTRGGHLAMAIPAGIAAGLLTRLALFIVTRPHSVLFPRLPTWQAIAGVIVGAIVSFALLRIHRAVGPAKIALSMLFLVVVLLLHWTLFDLRLAQLVIPDLWLK